MSLYKIYPVLVAISLLLAACGGAVADTPKVDESPIPPQSGEEALETPVKGAPETVTPVVVLPKKEGEEGMPAITPLIPPPPDRQAMQRGAVFPEKAELLILESYPIQVTLLIKGNLPTPCHILQAEMSPPDAENRIYVEVYSLVDPNLMCVQVLEPFEQRLSLGSFSSGKYSVWVNGQKVGEFDS